MKLKIVDEKDVVRFIDVVNGFLVERTVVRGFGKSFNDMVSTSLP